MCIRDRSRRHARKVSTLKSRVVPADGGRMRTRRFAASVMVLGLAMAASTCSRSTMLPDAYYAEHMVPIYPHARLTDQMGSNSTGDTPDESWDGMAWWFETKDDYDRIVAFYEAKLPGWQKETDGDGTITFKTIPEGGD